MLGTIIGIVVQYKEALFQGLLITLSLSLIVWICGITLGTLFGALANREKQNTGYILRVFSFLLVSIPFLVLLYWMHYPLQEVFGVVLNPFITAALALSLVNTVFVAQVIKNVLDEFPKQYSIAGKVCGMSDREVFLKIEFPIIFREAIPQLLTLQVTMLQMTVFASLISVEELFRVAQQINSVIYKPIEIYTALSLFFIGICLPLNLLAEWLKNTYTRNLSEA